MAVLTSRVNERSEAISQPRRHAGAGRRPHGARRRSCAAAGKARTAAASRARQAAAAASARRAPRPRHAVSRARAARRPRGLRRRQVPAPASSPASDAVSGLECMIVYQRRDRERAAPTTPSRSRSRPGPRPSRSRTTCPASTWSTPAVPTCRCRTRCFPTASTSGAIFFNQANMSAKHPAARRGLGSCTAGGAYCRRWPTNPSSCANRARSSLPARRW
jgi:hypothetical protein